MNPLMKWWSRKVMNKKWASGVSFILLLIIIPAILMLLSALYALPPVEDILKYSSSPVLSGYREQIGGVIFLAISILMVLPLIFHIFTLASECYLPEIAARQAKDFAVKYPSVKERLGILAQDAWRVDDATKLQEFLEKLRSLDRLKNEFEETDEKLSALREKIAALEKELGM